MHKFKTIKDRGRERRIAKIQAVNTFGAYKPARAERINRYEVNKQYPARLTRVLAVYGD